jgi:hypothetical protein
MSACAMGTHVLMHCRMEMTLCARRRRRAARLRERLALIVLALTALMLGLTGERWLLETTPVAANELTLATCVVDDVVGAVHPAAACTSASLDHPQGNTL